MGLDPATMAGIALAATATSGAVGAYSAISNANAAKASAEYNAQIAQNNATIASMNANSAIQEGNQKLQAAQEQAAQHQGMIRAVMGAGGIDLNSGSALRNQEGAAEVDQLNEATITNNAARSAWNYRNQGADYAAQSQLDTMQANQASSAGLMAGFGSLLSGASQFGQQWTNFSKNGAFSSS